jgi:hypothetical protein
MRTRIRTHIYFNTADGEHFYYINELLKKAPFLSAPIANFRIRYATRSTLLGVRQFLFYEFHRACKSSASCEVVKKFYIEYDTRCYDNVETSFLTVDICAKIFHKLQHS